MENTILELYLPWPPSINNYYGRTRAGMVYLKPAGRDYRKAVNEELLSQLPPDWLPIDYPIRVGIVLFPPDNRVRDLDNYKKALLDALTVSGVYKDDSLIDQDLTYRGERVKDGRVAVNIDYASPKLPFNSANPSVMWDIIDF